MRDDPRPETEEEKEEREKREKLAAEKRKGANTRVDVSIYRPGEGGNGVIGGVSLPDFLKQNLPDNPKGTKFIVMKAYPKNKIQDAYSKDEVKRRINEAFQPQAK